MKIRPLGAELFHRANWWTDGRTNGRTDMTKIIIYFRNIAKAPKTAHYLKHIDSKSDHKHCTLRHTLRVQLLWLWK